MKKQEIELAEREKTILVVDDEKMILNMIKVMLERWGHRVLTAESGKEAMDIAKTFDGDISVAILDMVLPDMGGVAIYRGLKEILPDLKVLVCSGCSMDGPVREILDEGAQGFIQKPLCFEVLSKEVNKILGRGR